jgi:L-aminopeptidase/D-esterase-like protein
MSTVRRPRAPDLDIRIGLLPIGANDAITDVDGVRVGHTTLIEGDGPLRVGVGAGAHRRDRRAAAHRAR